MKLNTATGSFDCGESIHISPHMTLEQAQRQHPQAQVQDIGTGSIWLHFSSAQVDDKIWGISACYRQSRLCMTLLAFQHVLEKPFSWDEWSEDAELEKLAQYKAWIVQNTGQEKAEFSWGSIGAYCNPKDCESKIVMSYKEEKS